MKNIYTSLEDEIQKMFCIPLGFDNGVKKIVDFLNGDLKAVNNSIHTEEGFNFSLETSYKQKDIEIAFNLAPCRICFNGNDCNTCFEGNFRSQLDLSITLWLDYDCIGDVFTSLRLLSSTESQADQTFVVHYDSLFQEILKVVRDGEDAYEYPFLVDTLIASEVSLTTLKDR